jgi:hypothetical protein
LCNFQKVAAVKEYREDHALYVSIDIFQFTQDPVGTNSYDGCNEARKKKLHDGRGNFIGIVLKLKEFGVKPSNVLPEQ